MFTSFLTTAQYIQKINKQASTPKQIQMKKYTHKYYKHFLSEGKISDPRDNPKIYKIIITALQNLDLYCIKMRYLS